MNYPIATRLYRNVKRQFYRLDDWVEVCSGIDATQLYFTHEDGKARRYIASRKARSPLVN